VELNSIQFSLAHSHKLTSEGFTIYTYDIPVPEPHNGSGQTPKQPFPGEKREETFRRATEEDPSPGWTDAIDVMCTEGQI